MKKNNTAEKTILKAEKISQALKEGTENTLRSILNEAISKVVNESLEDEEEIEDDSYEVEDVNTANDPEGEEIENQDQNLEDSTEETNDDEEIESDTQEDEEEGPDMEDFNVGDNCYDFTGVEGDDLFKLFKKTGDNDLVFVTKNEDGDYEVKDDETGAEYVIELDPEEGEADAEETDFEDENLGDNFDGEETEFEFEIGGDEEGEDLGDDSENFEDTGDSMDDDSEEIEIDLNDDEDEEEELNEENLSYTDSYQKDVFAKKPNMSEPGKNVNDWDEGAPKGAEKPWAGKGDMKPFGKKQELDENGSGKNSKRRMTKGMTGINNQGEGYHEESKAQNIDEAKIAKIVEAAKVILAENKNIRKELEATKIALKEAAVSNGAMCSLVNLFINESTTREEKKQIAERFLGAKTLKDVKTINESIKKELGAKHNSGAIVEHQISAKQTLNETKIYEPKNNPSLDLMNRLDNLWK